jgi:HEAT repeat protein
MTRYFMSPVFWANVGIATIFTQTWAGVTADDIRKMSLEDRRAVYRDMNSVVLDDPDATLPVLIVGLTDHDDIVVRNAVVASRWMMVGLQHLAHAGKEVMFDLGEFPRVQTLLAENLANSDADIRGSAAEALAYSAAPNPEFERLLVTTYRKETDAGVRALIIKTLGFAGYGGGISEKVMIDALGDEDPRVRSSAAIAFRKLTPDSALPKLVEMLSDTNMVRGNLVVTIGAYGTRAQPYLGVLNELLESGNAGGTLAGDIRAAIANIKNPSAVSVPPVIAVDLYRGG